MFFIAERKVALAPLTRTGGGLPYKAIYADCSVLFSCIIVISVVP